MVGHPDRLKGRNRCVQIGHGCADKAGKDIKANRDRHLLLLFWQGGSIVIQALAIIPRYLVASNV
jgi:hypothetical protein